MGVEYKSGIVLGMNMSEAQQQDIRSAASSAIFRLISVLGSPTLIDLHSVDGILADIETIKAIVYDLDAKAGHDDSTAIADQQIRSAA